VSILPRIGRFRRAIIILAIATCIGHVGGVFLKERVWYIRGSSMYPTFQDGRKLIMTWNNSTPHPGDVVLVNVKDPKRPDYEVWLKRIIAVPGNHILIRKGVYPVFVNGTPITELYLSENIRVHTYYEKSIDITLGSDEYFIMGDNREDSFDSRNIGPVSRDKIRHILGSYFTF